MIKTKEKPCKGTGIAKGHGCGTPTFHRVYGLGKMCGCYADWLLNTPAGNEKMERATLKATKPRRELEKAEKEHKNREKITTLINAVKDVCHEFIKLRDEGKSCISCGTPWKSDFDAGHYYKAELFSTLRFDERNINAQCIHCNRRLEGNLNMYEMRLPDRIGLEAFDNLRRLAAEDKRTIHKWEREKLKEIRSYYRSKIKSLKN